MFDKSDIAQPSTHWSLAFYSNRSFTVDTDANNELITDGEFVQPLTAVEIEALKKSGAKATVCLSSDTNYGSSVASRSIVFRTSSKHKLSSMQIMSLRRSTVKTNTLNERKQSKS